MKQPFKNYQVKKKKTSKHSDEWKELAEEMSEWYGQQMYSTFYKFGLPRIRPIFLALRKNEDRELSHLFHKLHNNNNDKEKVAKNIIDTFYRTRDIKKRDTMLEINRSLIGEKAYNYIISNLK